MTTITEPKIIENELLRCRNGGCTRKIYRGKYCFRCWAGVKWTSIIQRVENKNGNNPSYVGIPIKFTRESLIKWVYDNPPPIYMDIPSIDRIVPKLGYSPGNIRWLERNKNSAKNRSDVPEGFRVCVKCNIIKPLTEEYFGTNNSKNIPFQSYCKTCKKEYDRKWRKNR